MPVVNVAIFGMRATVVVEDDELDDELELVEPPVLVLVAPAFGCGRGNVRIFGPDIGSSKCRNESGSLLNGGRINRRFVDIGDPEGRMDRIGGAAGTGS